MRSAYSDHDASINSSSLGMLSVTTLLNFFMYFLWTLVPSSVDTELISCKLSLADLQGPKMHEINDAFVHWEFVCYSAIL